MARPAGLLLGLAVIAGTVLGFPAVVLGLVAMLLVRLAGKSFSIWWAEMLLACLLLGAIRHPVIANRTSPAELAQADRVIGQVDSLPISRQRGDQMVLRVTRARIDNTWQPANGKVLVYVTADYGVTVDDELEVVWGYTPLELLSPSSRAFVQSQDAIGIGHVWWARVRSPNHSIRRHLVDVRRVINDRIQHLVPDDAGALMTGIVTGDDSGLTEGARQAFLATGTSHVTAVSGTNVAMLLALWERTIRRRTRRRNLVIQGGIIASIWLYAMTTGLEPSAMRAATVSTLIVLSGRFGRRADAMTVLAMATAGLLVWQPYLTRSVGFWLSVAASAALIGAFNHDAGAGWRSKLKSTVIGLIAVQFATLPIIVSVFGTWPPVSLVVNLLLAPLMVIAFPLAFTGAVVAFIPVVGPVLLRVPALVCDVALAVVSRLATVLPPVSLEPMGIAGAVLLAVPCLVGLLLMQVDIRRWWPRWQEMAAGQWRTCTVAIAGFVTGGLVALEIWRVFGG